MVQSKVDFILLAQVFCTTYYVLVKYPRTSHKWHMHAIQFSIRTTNSIPFQKFHKIKFHTVIIAKWSGVVAVAVAVAYADADADADAMPPRVHV